MWIYPAQLGILIPGGLRPIAPYLPPSLGQRAVIAIPRFGSRGSNCRSFRSSHAPVLIVGSTAELLVGYSGGQFSRLKSRSRARLSSHAARLGQQWHCMGPGPRQLKIRPAKLPALP